MYITCLDLEGVLVPEIWIAFAKASGIPELTRTTRDEPDYEKLMNWRLGILAEHHLGLKEIQETIATIDPLPGAKEFLDELRSFSQVIIISDTFTQFASPLMKKLGWPTIFCNSLEAAEDGRITGFKMRIENSKLTTVKALQSIGYETIASGDSFYNQDDLFWLSRVIHKESGNQPMEGRMAVGNVVLNRVADPAFPDTVEGVLAQKNQFTTYKSGVLAATEPSEKSTIAAKLVMDGGEVEETKGATFFDSGSNSWAARNKRHIATIGGHKFYG